MSRTTSSAKTREWTERFERFKKSGRTVAEFCLNESVSQPSFYHWKRRLVDPRPESAPSDEPSSRESPETPADAFQPIFLASQGKMTSSVRIRLPGGSVIEFGADPAVIETVLHQLLSHPTATGADPCSL